MPEAVEKCVRAIMKDPNFKPQKGRTKEQSAWAICTDRYNKNQATAKHIRRK